MGIANFKFDEKFHKRLRLAKVELGIDQQEIVITAVDKYLSDRGL